MKFKNFTFFLAIFFLLFTPTFVSAQIITEGLIGYYPLDGNPADSSGMQHDGTIIGSVSNTEDRFGTADKAYLLEGGYIDLGNPDAYRNTTAISISIWVKQTVETGSFRGLVTKWGDFGADGYYLGINNVNNSPRWNIDDPTIVEGTLITNDIWTHIVATYEEDSVKLYQDGVLTASAFITGFNANTAASVLIGEQDYLSGVFLGAVDEVLIYDRALSAEEVAILFDPTTPIVEVSKYANQISVYPNPSNGYLNIDNKTSFEVLPYTIFSMDGSLVKSGIYDGSIIDLDDLPQGFYFLKMTIEDEFVTKKVALTK